MSFFPLPHWTTNDCSSYCHRSIYAHGAHDDHDDDHTNNVLENVWETSIWVDENLVGCRWVAEGEFPILEPMGDSILVQDATWAKIVRCGVFLLHPNRAPKDLRCCHVGFRDARVHNIEVEEDRLASVLEASNYYYHHLVRVLGILRGVENRVVVEVSCCRPRAEANTRVVETKVLVALEVREASRSIHLGHTCDVRVAIDHHHHSMVEVGEASVTSDVLVIEDDEWDPVDGDDSEEEDGDLAAAAVDDGPAVGDDGNAHGVGYQHVETMHCGGVEATQDRGQKAADDSVQLDEGFDCTLHARDDYCRVMAVGDCTASGGTNTI